jgi:hypothetical protein
MKNVLKKILKTVLQIAMLFVSLIVIAIIDTSIDYIDNPLTITLIVLFWVGFAYILFPSFIRKYWKFIAFYFTPLLLFMTYIRLFSGSEEAYLAVRDNYELLVFLIPIPMVLLICLWIYEQWKWIQSLKAGKREAEISLLRSQINPHFFFNTLNNLYALTITKSDQAPEVILKLSDMMRYTIYEGDKKTVKLQDEINYLNDYIDLHKIRYKKPVEILFKHTVDPSLSVAPLLFIILLENAFKHGVESAVENPNIHIRLYEDGHFICFDIENNYNPNNETESNGIGLDNLKKRLSLLYKGKHAYKVTQEEDKFIVNVKISKDA